MPLTPEPTSPSPITTQERGVHSRPAAARYLQGGARAKPPSRALVWPAPAPHRVAWALLPLRPAPASSHPLSPGKVPAHLPCLLWVSVCLFYPPVLPWAPHSHWPRQNSGFHKLLLFAWVSFLPQNKKSQVPKNAAVTFEDL